MDVASPPTFMDFALISPDGIDEHASKLWSCIDAARIPGDVVGSWARVDGEKTWGVSQPSLWLEASSVCALDPLRWAEEALQSFVESKPGFQGLAACVAYGPRWESVKLIVLNGQGEVVRSMMEHESLERGWGVDVQEMLVDPSRQRQVGQDAFPLLVEGCCSLMGPYRVHARALRLGASLPAPSRSLPSPRL